MNPEKKAFFLSQSAIEGPAASNTFGQDPSTGSMSCVGSMHCREVSHITKCRDFEGNKIIDEYAIVGDLGRGAYGKVKLAAHKDNPLQLLAIKIINISLSCAPTVY